MSPIMTELLITDQALRQSLHQVFPNAIIQVIDDTAAHAGHSGAHPSGQGSHFTVRIRCESLRGVSPVARHRLVYDALKTYIDAGLHALAIDAKDDSHPL